MLGALDAHPVSNATRAIIDRVKAFCCILSMTPCLAAGLAPWNAELRVGRGPFRTLACMSRADTAESRLHDGSTGSRMLQSAVDLFPLT